MQIRELALAGAWELIPTQHQDDRGLFLELFTQQDVTRASGRPLTVAQVNSSVSGAGVLRGVHFADVPPGQAKYVTCTAGAILDMVVDIRVGSPTFGSVASVRLDGRTRSCVYLTEGLGHAFVALEPGSAVVYLCSTQYDASREHAILATDPELALPLPPDLPLVMSEKDSRAPTLRQAAAEGLLPRWDACTAYLPLSLSEDLR